MPITLDGGAGVTFPDAVQQTNALTNTGGTPRYYAARAWVNFDGNSGAIRAQANITSVSRTGTGQYTITIDTDMPDANYVIIATAGTTLSSAQYYNARLNSAPTTGSFTISVLGQSSGVPTYLDADYVHVVIFR